MQKQQRRGLSPDYKIFCDESCHLPHDTSNVMVFGAIRCETATLDQAVATIKALRTQHNYHQELKWSKLLSTKMEFYQDLISYFARTPALRFKATVVLNKQGLDHAKYNAGSAGTFYYKMAYYTLRDLLTKGKGHRLYLDFMDTQGSIRAQKMQEILENGSADWITTHLVRSHESQLIQLCDLLTGAIAYANRTDVPKNSELKLELIKRIEATFGRTLLAGTPPWEEKFNIFMFSPRKS